MLLLEQPGATERHQLLEFEEELAYVLGDVGIQVEGKAESVTVQRLVLACAEVKRRSHQLFACQIRLASAGFRAISSDSVSVRSLLYLFQRNCPVLQLPIFRRAGM